MHFFNRKLLLIAALFILPAVPALGQQFSRLEPVYEITGCSGTDFQNIQAVAADEIENTLTVLEGPPMHLCFFGLHTGEALRRIPVHEKIRPPLLMWQCGGATVVATTKSFYAYGRDGRLIEDYKPPEQMPRNPLKIMCAPHGGLLVLDKKEKELVFLDDKGKRTRTLPLDSDKKKKQARIGFLKDAALTPLGSLYVLDSESNQIKQFDRNGKFRKVAVGEGFHSEEYSELLHPALVAADALDTIWIYDEGDRALKAYDNFGFLKHIVLDANEDGFVFQYPEWLYIDSFNRLILHDSGTRSIKAFDLGSVE